jgi:hypothetical protein
MNMYLSRQLVKCRGPGRYHVHVAWPVFPQVRRSSCRSKVDGGRPAATTPVVLEAERRQNRKVLTRSAAGYLTIRSDSGPDSAAALQSDGYAVLPSVFTLEEVAELCHDIERVFGEFPPDERGDTLEEAAPFRYEMLNRSGPVQTAIGHRRILEAVEPLLGEDCHVIANTA